MAKYTIKYPDGEQEEIQLFGKLDERYRRIDYLEKYGKSPKQREVERQLQTEDAKAKAIEKKLPELKGSEKQIAWAVRIRDKMLDEANDYLDKLNIADVYLDIADEDVKSEWQERIDTIKNNAKSDIFRETSSSWWIDNRDSFGDRLVRDRLKEKYLDEIKTLKSDVEEAQKVKTSSASLPTSQPVQSKSTPPKKETRQYTMAELQKIHNSRRPQSIAMDEMQSHAVTINPDSPKVKQWISDQGKADIRGIDSPKASLSGRKKLRISPTTRRLPK